MKLARWAGLGAALAVTGLALSGCVTLFPKTPPVQLYRFDVAAPTEAPADGAVHVWVVKAPNTFARGAEADRLLSARGDQVAYIGGARWITSASGLFDDAESHAFDQSAGAVRLVRRGESGAAPLGLRLEVQTFETRYAEGGVVPTVVVQVRAILTRELDRRVVAVQLFESRQPAATNRISAIVPAYSAAVGAVLGQVVGWTNHYAAGGG